MLELSGLGVKWFNLRTLSVFHLRRSFKSPMCHKRNDDAREQLPSDVVCVPCDVLCVHVRVSVQGVKFCAEDRGAVM